MLPLSTLTEEGDLNTLSNIILSFKRISEKQGGKQKKRGRKEIFLHDIALVTGIQGHGENLQLIQDRGNEPARALCWVLVQGGEDWECL